MNKSYLVALIGSLINMAWAFHPPHDLASSGEGKNEAARRPAAGNNQDEASRVAPVREEEAIERPAAGNNQGEAARAAAPAHGDELEERPVARLAERAAERIAETLAALPGASRNQMLAFVAALWRDRMGFGGAAGAGGPRRRARVSERYASQHYANAARNHGRRAVLPEDGRGEAGGYAPARKFPPVKALKHTEFEDQVKYYGKYVTDPREAALSGKLAYNFAARAQKRRIRPARRKIYFHNSRGIGDDFKELGEQSRLWSEEKVLFVAPLLRSHTEIKGSFLPGAYKMRKGQKIDTLYICVHSNKLEEAKRELWNLCNADAREIKVFTDLEAPAHINRLVNRALCNRWGRLESFSIHRLDSSKTEGQLNEFAKSLFPKTRKYSGSVRSKTLSKFVARDVSLDEETLKLVLANHDVLQEVDIQDGPICSPLMFLERKFPKLRRLALGWDEEEESSPGEEERSVFKEMLADPHFCPFPCLEKFEAYAVINSFALEALLRGGPVRKMTVLRDDKDTLQDLASFSLPYLERLSMKWRWDNEGALPFAKALWRKNLRELKIRGGAAQYCFKEEPDFPLLEKLYISGGDFWPTTFEAEQLPNLRTLIAPNGCFDLGDISKILVGWGQNLTHVNFNDQGENDRQNAHSKWTKIVPMPAKVRKNLKELHLGDIGIPSDKLNTFCGGGIFWKLKVLDLSDNKLEARGLKAFFVKNLFPELEKVYLGKNDLQPDFFNWLRKLQKKGRLPKAAIYE